MNASDFALIRLSFNELVQFEGWKSNDVALMSPHSELMVMEEISDVIKVWSVGDLVVYKKSKVSNSPGTRAKNVSPHASGDSYSYTVDKYWIVKEVLPSGELLVQTVRGKEHTLPADDFSLRRPNIWERWFLRRRFRELNESLKAASDSAGSSGQ